MISFVVLTKDSPETTLRLVESIHNLSVPNYELIVIGGQKVEGNWVEWDEKKWPDNVSRKRNEAAKLVKNGVIVYVHDYFQFPPDWYKNIVEFGFNWDVYLNRILRPDGRRYLDWVEGWIHKKPFRYKDYTEPYSRHSYVSGGFFVVKKSVMQRFPFDETLKRGQGEDWKWSDNLNKNNIKVIFDANNLIRTQFNKYNYENISKK